MSKTKTEHLTFRLVNTTCPSTYLPFTPGGDLPAPMPAPPPPHALPPPTPIPNDPISQEPAPQPAPPAPAPACVPSAQEFNILGASYNGFNLNKPGVSVDVPQSSAAQAQADNLNTAFLIKEIKIRVSNVEQLNEIIYIKTKLATGELTEVPFNPSDYVNPNNHQDKLIDTGPIAIKVYGNVGFRGILLPKSKMTIYITLEYTYRPSNYITGPASLLMSNPHKLMRLLPIN